MTYRDTKINYPLKRFDLAINQMGWFFYKSDSHLADPMVLSQGQKLFYLIQIAIWI